MTTVEWDKDLLTSYLSRKLLNLVLHLLNHPLYIVLPLQHRLVQVGDLGSEIRAKDVLQRDFVCRGC